MTPALTLALAALAAASIVGLAGWRVVEAPGAGPLDRHLRGPDLQEAGPGRGEVVHVLLCIADHYEPRVGGRAARSGPARGSRPGSATIPASSAASATATAGRPGTRSSTRSRSTSPSTSTPWPASAAPASARSRSTSTTTATPPRTCARRSASSRSCSPPARPAGPRPRDGRAGLRVHPRQLGPGQLAARRPLVRGQQRARRPPRDRLLRRLHPARRPPARRRPGKINSIYYATDDPSRPQSHDRGSTSATARPRPTR